MYKRRTSLLKMGRNVTRYGDIQKCKHSNLSHCPTNPRDTVGGLLFLVRTVGSDFLYSRRPVSLSTSTVGRCVLSWSIPTFPPHPWWYTSLTTIESRTHQTSSLKVIELYLRKRSIPFATVVSSCHTDLP